MSRAPTPNFAVLLLTHDGRAPAGASRRKTPHTQVVRSRKRAQRHVLPMLGGGRTAPRPHPNPARARRKCGKVSNFTIRCVLLMLNTRLNTTLTNIIILNYSKNYRGKSDCTKISCNRNTNLQYRFSQNHYRHSRHWSGRAIGSLFPRLETIHLV